MIQTKKDVEEKKKEKSASLHLPSDGQIILIED